MPDQIQKLKHGNDMCDLFQVSGVSTIPGSFCCLRTCFTEYLKHYKTSIMERFCKYSKRLNTPQLCSAYIRDFGVCL